MEYKEWKHIRFLGIRSSVDYHDILEELRQIGQRTIDWQLSFLYDEATTDYNARIYLDDIEILTLLSLKYDIRI